MKENRLNSETLLYAQVADQIQEKIRQSVYRAEDKLPSIRVLAASMSVSVSTAVAAYNLLEDRGVIYAKTKSGYFVKQTSTKQVKPPVLNQEPTLPAEVSTMQRVMEVMRDSSHPSFVSFGAAVPCSDFPVLGQLKKYLPKRYAMKLLWGLAMTPLKETSPFGVSWLVALSMRVYMFLRKILW